MNETNVIKASDLSLILCIENCVSNRFIFSCDHMIISVGIWFKFIN